MIQHPCTSDAPKQNKTRYRKEQNDKQDCCFQRHKQVSTKGLFTHSRSDNLINVGKKEQQCNNIGDNNKLSQQQGEQEKVCNKYNFKET